MLKTRAHFFYLQLLTLFCVAEMVFPPLVARAQMIPTTAKILRLSRSKQSVILDRGHLDGWRIGDYAVFLLRPEDTESAHYYVGTGKLIAQEGNASNWLISEIADKRALVEGASIIVKNQRQTFQGRVEKPIGSLKTVGDSNESAFPSSSAKNNYDEKLVQRPLPLPNDLSMSGMREDQADWQKKEERLDESGEVKAVLDVGPFSDDRSRDEIQDLADEDEFYRQNEQDLQELQDPEFTLQDKYRQSLRDPRLGDFSALTSTPNTYQKAEDFLTNKEILQKREAADLISEDGPDWSEHFNDAELSEFVNRTGLNTETERQRLAYETVEYLNDVSLSLGMTLADSGNDGDYQNQNTSNYGFALSHEITLGYRWTALQQLAFSYYLFTQATNVGLDLGANGAAQELGLGAHLLWYPWQNPLALGRPLFFVGLGLKRGQGDVKVTTSGEQASYATSSLGDFKAGIKFRLSRRWGTKLTVDYASTRWRKDDLGENDVFPGESTNSELKVAASFSLYF